MSHVLQAQRRDHRRRSAVKKLCPNCEELLKPTSNPEVGQCSGCGWSGHYWRAAKEPSRPAVPPMLFYVSIDIEITRLAHTAVEDALAVVRLVRLGIKRLRENP